MLIRNFVLRQTAGKILNQLVNLLDVIESTFVQTFTAEDHLEREIDRLFFEDTRTTAAKLYDIDKSDVTSGHLLALLIPCSNLVVKDVAMRIMADDMQNSQFAEVVNVMAETGKLGEVGDPVKWNEGAHLLPNFVNIKNFSTGEEITEFDDNQLVDPAKEKIEELRRAESEIVDAEVVDIEESAKEEK